MDKYAFRHRREFGDPESFRHSKIVACDASVGRESWGRGLLRSGAGEFLAVAGAVVDDQGHWWAWRAEVALRHADRAGAWAECWTLFRALQLCRPGAMVLADHQGAISLAQSELCTGVSWALPRPPHAIRRSRIEPIFGPLPVVRRASIEVRWHDGDVLHRRADRLARIVREGGKESVVVARCDRVVQE